MNGPDQRAEQIFAAVIEITDPAERRAYMERACAGDARLRAEVESLVVAHEQAGEFLQTDSPEQPTVMGGTVLAAPLTENPGTRIGRYKLLEQIGEGGFGVVWMAEQEEPVRRRVALKIIKLGMDTREVVARFEAERQALAMMDHPNIARVFDGGTTESGRPYFVMELVRGEPITKYCDEQRLSLEERLELFVQVCQAVQHAHQKGVIHRDLKPSNILVAIHDDKPVPKVIDFGIAKATQQRLTEKTLFTRFNQFVGTPAYMSPEQAGLSSLDIDTRSDIYSLGVLLYELLTGRTPFSKEELLAGGYDEICRIIREKEPPKPSTRLSTMSASDRSTIAAQRKVPPEKLGRLVRGELDWVVMKCLEKDRARRYETANGLAMDLRRYLDQEPITARPPSNLYRFQKLVRRNKLAIATAGAIAASLIIGLAMATWMFFRQRQASQRALANQIKAQTEAGKSQQVTRFLKEMLSGIKPSVALGRDTTLLKEILDKASERVDNELRDQPEVEAELRDTLGNVYSEVSQFAKAEAMYRRLLQLRQQLRGGEHREIAEALGCLGDSLRQLGKSDEAETLLHQAVTMGRKLLGSEDALVADLVRDLGLALASRGKQPEAEVLLCEAVETHRRLSPHPTEELASALHCLAVIIWEEQRPAEAEVLQREAHEIFRKLKGDESPSVAHSLHNLASMAQSQGREAEAEQLERDALALRQKLLPHDHWEVAQSLLSLAIILSNKGDLAGAEPLMREALQINLRLGETSNLDWALQSLAGLLDRQGKLAEVEVLHLEVLAARQRAFGNDAEETAKSRHELAHALQRQNKLPESEMMFREALLVFKKVRGDKDPQVAHLLQSLAEVLQLQRKLPEAEQLLNEAVSAAPQDPQAQAELVAARGRLHARSGRWKEAALDLRTAVELRPQAAMLRFFLAPLLVQLRDQEGYENLRRSGLQLFGGTDNPVVAQIMAKHCLILPWSGVGLEAAGQWADRALAVGSSDRNWPAFLFTKALAEYRQGNFAAGVEWAEKALAKPDEDSARDMQASVLSAMAQHRLGQNAEAKVAFAQAQHIAATKLPRSDSSDFGDNWMNWIIAHVLMREAKDLIEGQDVATKPEQK